MGLPDYISEDEYADFYAPKWCKVFGGPADGETWEYCGREVSIPAFRHVIFLSNPAMSTISDTYRLVRFFREMNGDIQRRDFYLHESVTIEELKMELNK